MEAAVNNGICRCCASDGTCKDVKSTYHWMGEEEIYSDMLRDCFDISLIQSEYDDGGICEVCITQLRNASNFKKQVLHTEKQFELRIQGKLFKSDIVKIEPSKVDNEANDSDNYLSEEFSCGGEDFEVPIKIETDDVKPKKRAAAAKASTSRAKKAKANDGETSTKRVDERRSVITRNKKPSEVKLKIMTSNHRISDDDIQIIDGEKNQLNLRQILLYSNANPIHRKDDIGFCCGYCFERFPDPADLKLHFLENHKDESMKIFTIRRMYRQSVKLDITYLNCTLCGIDMDNLYDLMEHLQMEHDKIVYKDVRSMIFPFKFESSAMRCTICTAVFNTFKVLLVHMNTHFRNFICGICSSGFVCEYMLRNHVKRHATGQYKCGLCEKTFINEQKRREHTRYKHLGFNKRNKCKFCDERFYDYQRKIDHMVKEHGMPRAVFKCHACERTFPHQRGLTIHTKKDHLLEKKHKCSECDMRFYNKGKLNNHMVKHTGIKEYQCHVCLKSYGTKYNLRAHLRIHANDRRFECSECGQTFIQKCSLQGHMRSKHHKVV